ncbi:MAG TPA: hypothetical protein VI423_06295 [Paenisporosarcina sp.]|nr:hypothetical protein [Paenisporosarcina sp.]
MNIDLRLLISHQLSKVPHSKNRMDIPHKFRGLMIGSFFDPTITSFKKVNNPASNERDILNSINRNTGKQFQSIAEIAQYVDTLTQKKLLTD